MSPDSSTAYVLEEANAPHPGELYEINLATDTASAPIRVGVGASGFVVVGGTDPLAPVPAGVAKRLPVTATVEKKLIAAFARVKKLPLDGVRLNPAYVVYAYDPTTKTYWSEANFSHTSKDTTSVALSFEDAGGLGIFSKGVSGAWTFRGASLPITCAEEKYVPAAVLSVWSVPLTSSAC